MGRLFGTDGVRGRVGEELTPELALRLGRAIGAYFGRGARILVGRDARAGGAMIKNAVVAGLLAEGVKVYDAGFIPTPGLQYNVKVGPYDGGVMVTASHNPPEYNGVKVIGGDGIEIPREDEAVIEEYYFRGTASRLEWRSYTWDPRLASEAIDIYVDAIVAQVEGVSLPRSPSVVVDCANSVGALATPRVLAALGARVRTINCNMDPLFPGREPEPTPETLADAARLVAETGSLFGVGHDGDADRAIVVDDKGRVHWGDRSGTLLAAYAAEKWRDLPRRVYTGVSSSTLVEEYLRPRGIEVVWTPVGSVVISRMIVRDGGAIAGFEENGGYMHVPHQIVRDGAMKAALLLAMIGEYGRSLSSLFDELPRYYPLKTKVPATREQALCAVEAIKEHYRGLRQVTIDGVKVFGDDFWLLVRPSGTEPVVRIMAEARDPEKVRSVVEEAKRIIAEKCGVRTS